MTKIISILSILFFLYFEGSDSIEVICMDELGCFGITEDFKRSHRFRNVLPQSRKTINTQFHLYTRANPQKFESLLSSDLESIKNSNFNFNSFTKFITHGFLDPDVKGEWIQILKDRFLALADFNIIVVDWTGGNQFPYYQAVANTRVVGAEIAQMIYVLENAGELKREDTHLIGHSLGAHVMGYAGERLPGLFRITGLDPAGPYFHNTPPSVRLDPTDAFFVDVIHTDAGENIFQGLGTYQLVGHIDIFPNNGSYQPGCGLDRFTTIPTDTLVHEVTHLTFCNHLRATELFIDSLNTSNALPVAYRCTSWKNYIEGRCAECGKDTEKCVILGIRADENRYFEYKHQMPFYLKTSGKSPYWLYHYKIVVKLQQLNDSSHDFHGKFIFELHGSKASKEFLVHNTPAYLQHGQQYQYLVTTETNLGDIVDIHLRWFLFTLIPSHKAAMYVEYITIVPMHIIEKSPRNMSRRIFCNDARVSIRPNQKRKFTMDGRCRSQ